MPTTNLLMFHQVAINLLDMQPRTGVSFICYPSWWENLCCSLEKLLNSFVHQQSQDHVASLKILIEDYIDFPDHSLKPKHHYLRHYTQLITEFGPLIRLWNQTPV